MTRVGLAGDFRHICLVAACVMLAAFLLSCAGDDTDAAKSERMLLLEAKAHSLEESIETLQERNAALHGEIAALHQAQDEFVQQQEAAQFARENEDEVADFEEDQEEQLFALEEGQDLTLIRMDELDEQVSALEEGQVLTFSLMGELDVQVSALEEGQAITVERLDASESRLSQLEDTASELNTAFRETQSAAGVQLDDLDTRLKELEATAYKMGWSLPSKEDWSKQTDKSPGVQEESVLERTTRLAEAAGGEVYNIDSREPEARAILVMPLEPIDGNPLIVSLHGYGGNSADHSLYIPLHERVISRGFGLLLPNGTLDGEGHPSWYPTDGRSSTGKASADDYTYLAGLVARAREVKDFGPVYFFGHSNGGFMAYHVACKGLPGLRAVASLAGTSYVEDSECDGAPPVSVLHIHGTDDDVVLFEGEVAEPVGEGESNSPFYASVKEMMMRWSQRAGCEWPEVHHTYATFELDQ